MSENTLIDDDFVASVRRDMLRFAQLQLRDAAQIGLADQHRTNAFLAAASALAVAQEAETQDVPAELVTRLAGPEREVWNTYGPTETTVMATLAGPLHNVARAVPIGRGVVGAD